MQYVFRTKILIAELLVTEIIFIDCLDNLKFFIPNEISFLLWVGFSQNFKSSQNHLRMSDIFEEPIKHSFHVSAYVAALILKILIIKR